MNRLLPILLGPEMVLTLLTAFVILYCARHGSYSADDVRAVQRLIWLVPLLAVPLAFATFALSESKSWIWLGRVNLAVLISVAICAGKIVQGFGAPGSGPAGQEAGMVLMVVLGACLTALANVICGTVILGETKPAFASWMRAHTVTGYLITGVALALLAIAHATAAGISMGLVHSLTSKR